MEVKIGRVTHYFGKISCAVLELSDELKLGDEIRVQGHSTNFTQTVQSMQVEHDAIEVAMPGMDVAIKVADRVRKGDEVFKVMS